MNFIYRLVALFILIAISPIILLFSFAILFEDGLPFLFFQDRIGKNKKLFKIIKLRTMKKNTPNLGTHLVSENSYLMTGKIIRKLKIDELPQLVNLIKGELNIVGPRPGLPNQVELILEREKLNIFKIKPGISGLAQISGYDMSDPKKLAKVDKIYVDNSNWILDLKIILATIFPPLRESIKTKFINDI